MENSGDQRGIRAARLAPLAAAVLTFIIFLPSLRGGFLSWDDAANILQNDMFRGLDAERLKWMFTSFNLGPYTPITWLTLAFDFRIWGMNPLGYHLTSVLLHCANAGVFCALCLRLFNGGARPAPGKAAEAAGAALLAALIFAAHPLRAETASWLSGRHDELCTLFYMLTLITYLRWHTPAGAPAARPGLSMPALLLFLGALLSKGTAVTLPLVLLLLDFYPLGRLGAAPRGWLAGSREVLLEKLPFFALSFLFGLLAIAGQAKAGTLHAYDAMPLASRAAQVIYGLAFYPLKTLLPFNLSPIYQFTVAPGLADPRVIAALLFFSALCAAAFLLRKSLPSVPAAWVFYLLTIWPVAGAARINSLYAADRYTYLPCLGFAALAGGAWLRMSGRLRAVRAPLALAAILVLSGLAWRQQAYWHDSETLWRRVLALNPAVYTAHYNLGLVLAGENRFPEAEQEFRAALRLGPGMEETQNNLAGVLFAQGKLDEAAYFCRETLKADPTRFEARTNLGRVLMRQGKLAEAEKEFIEVLRLRPGLPSAQKALEEIAALRKGGAAR